MERREEKGPGSAAVPRGADSRAVKAGSADEGDAPWSQLASVAGRVHSEGVSRGERAQLRRMRGDDIPPEIYWRLTADLTWPSGRETFDRFWMTVLPLMTRNRHTPKACPGRVLADAGVKPARVERWLRRDRESAWAEAGRLLSITKGTPIDWAQLGYLLYAWNDPEVKRRFARDYFRTARRAAHAHTDEKGDL